jgi:hypothetical protein
LKFEEKKILISVVLWSIEITEQVTVDGFMQYFACAMSLLSVRQLPVSIQGLHLPGQHFHGGNSLVKSFSALVALCSEIFWEKSK